MLSVALIARLVAEVFLPVTVCRAVRFLQASRYCDSSFAVLPTNACSNRSCLRCEYCNENLRIGSYAYDTSGVCKGKFFCVAHFRMERPSERWSQMMRRKEAFLQEEPRPAQILPKKYVCSPIIIDSWARSELMGSVPSWLNRVRHELKFCDFRITA